METLTVRINRACHAKLQELSEQTSEPMVTILEKAVEKYRREQFLKRANAEFDRLKKDRKAWKQELQERAAWDSTLRDGLEK
jgi:predicted transcriptional regulator